MASATALLDTRIMNVLTKQHLAFLACALIAAGCASTGGGVVGDVAPVGRVESIGPLDGTNYLMYYGDETGIRIRNTMAVVDSLLIPGAQVSRVQMAPDGSAAAVEYRVGDAVVIGVLRGAGGGMVTVHEGTAAGDDDGDDT